MFEVTPIPALRDNYIWFIKNKASQHVAIVDPGEVAPVVNAVSSRQLIPAAIIITHHHWDHTNGIEELVNRYRIPVYAPAAENIKCKTQGLKEGRQLKIDEIGLCFNILDVPGHTAGALAYYGHGMIFSGDTLFAAGCGRLFEGTAEQMYASLNKFKQLPEECLLYCGHEYTCANLQFAQCLEPDNRDIFERLQIASSLHREKQPTVPGTLAEEFKTNPFLRCEQDAVIESAGKHAGRQCRAGADVFAVIRNWKDGFQAT